MGNGSLLGTLVDYAMITLTLHASVLLMQDQSFLNHQPDHQNSQNISLILHNATIWTGDNQAICLARRLSLFEHADKPLHC